MVQQFDPIRLLAELNAMGVRFVLVTDSAGPSGVLTKDRLEIFVADDEEDIDRLRALLIALEAEQDELSTDPHRAVFRTPLGRIECVELPAQGEFAELERRSGHLDFGNGVIVRSAHQTEATVHVGVATAPMVEMRETEPIEDRDERPPVRQRIWEKLEHIDDFLSGLGGHSETDR